MNVTLPLVIRSLVLNVYVWIYFQVDSFYYVLFVYNLIYICL